ncbi:hypothetical protein C8J57DRAFT_1477536 [Mycena rebaudengoi]|nr:hypothetical protein C8J57DRAFT_1477536 [Mycena rebaudengoi]
MESPTYGQLQMTKPDFSMQNEREERDAFLNERSHLPVTRTSSDRRRSKAGSSLVNERLEPNPKLIGMPATGIHPRFNSNGVGRLSVNVGKVWVRSPGELEEAFFISGSNPEVPSTYRFASPWYLGLFTRQFLRNSYIPGTPWATATERGYVAFKFLRTTTKLELLLEPGVPSFELRTVDDVGTTGCAYKTLSLCCMTTGIRTLKSQIVALATSGPLGNVKKWYKNIGLTIGLTLLYDLYSTLPGHISRDRVFPSVLRESTDWIYGPRLTEYQSNAPRGHLLEKLSGASRSHPEERSGRGGLLRKWIAPYGVHALPGAEAPSNFEASERRIRILLSRRTDAPLRGLTGNAVAHGAIADAPKYDPPENIQSTHFTPQAGGGGGGSKSAFITRALEDRSGHAYALVIEPMQR